MRESDRLESWIYQITLNAIIDHYCRARPQDELPDSLASPLDEEPDAVSQLASSVKGMLNCVPEKYRQALEDLHQQQVATAGYVDKPAANLVVRLLEVALCPETEMTKIKDFHPLHGVSDTALLKELLAMGERYEAMIAADKAADARYR